MQASESANVDDIIELVIIVMFLVIGVTNTSIYVQWCSSHIFDDNIIDKVKYTVNVEQTDLGELNDMELSAEQVIFMTRFKSNNYNQKTPSLIVQPQKGVHDYAMFLPEPNTTWKNYIVNKMNQHYKTINFSTRYTLNLSYLDPSSSTVRNLVDGTPVNVSPVEIAVTNITGAPRSNPAYGRNGIVYVQPQTPDGWYVWQVLPQ